MATQSQAPPSDDNPPKPDLTRATTENQQDVQVEAPKQNSPTSVFVNSEPMREEQVQNAVKFLSHPKVRGSPVMYRRSFLEKKGLTKEEIDEAFRRVPDPSPSVQASGGNQDGQKTSPGIQTQYPVQALQPVAAAPPNAVSPVVSRYRFHWSHAVLAVGFLAASGAGTAVIIKNAIIPRLKSWIRKVVSEEVDSEEVDSVKKTDSKPSLAEEAAVAAKAAAAAAADVAKASQEMMNSKNEERRYFAELMNMLDVQVQEMKSMRNSIQKLEGETTAQKRNHLIEQEDHQLNIINSKRPYVNGKADYDSRSVRSASPPAAAEPTVAPHPKSFMDIMAMVQRGERPPNIREINDLPPNPNQQPSNPRLAPRAKPWEVGQVQNYSSQVTQSQASSEGVYSNMQDNGLNHLSNGNGSAPWWQQNNSRITEIENEDEFKTRSYGAQPSEVPVRRTWVPPQPPPVQMPEAAEAIRRPKPLAQKEPSDDDQLEAHPAGVTDELRRVTKIAESGGAVETKSESSGLSSSEIQEAKDEIYG